MASRRTPRGGAGGLARGLCCRHGEVSGWGASGGSCRVSRINLGRRVRTLGPPLARGLTPLAFVSQAFTLMELWGELAGLRVGAVGEDTSLCRSRLR